MGLVWIVCGTKHSQQGGEELPLISESESRTLHRGDRTEAFGYHVWHSRGCHRALLSLMKVSEIGPAYGGARSLAGCRVFEDDG